MSWTVPPVEMIDTLLSHLSFDSNGLITAIAQDEKGQILMLAWMNRTSLRESLLTGRVCYYSRSRRTLWRKGETSGQEQYLIHMDVDCDRDTLLLTVHQKGVACHTGRRSCFYQRFTPQGLTETAMPDISPETLYPER